MRIHTAQQSNKDWIFVLGAEDPEMSAIQRVLTAVGITFVYATFRGRRVSAVTAYKADGTTRPIPLGMQVAVVECSVAGTKPDMIIDHHREGDPGFGKPPQLYWEGSSIGQTVQFLTSERFGANDRNADLLRPMEWELKLVAAADHCLSHAYKGLCPGIDHAALRLWRAVSRSGHQGCSPREILQRVDKAMEKIRQLPRIRIEGHEVADSIGAGKIRELPEACAVLGVPVQYEMADRETNRDKVGILGGCPDVTAAWMKWAREAGLADVYGDPARGFAGGYRASRRWGRVAS